MKHSRNHFPIQNNENKTLVVIVLTLVTMAVEIVAGNITHSMALLADGWHMGTHAFALTITYAAYVLTRKFKDSELFAMGTGKISSLAAFSSSIFLGLTAIGIIYESVIRLIHPVKIAFSDAILIATIGLAVNLVCLFIMEYKSTHKDYNFKSAYLHILTDALTSILAITALLLGKLFHLYQFDPIIGIVGGIIILKWAFGLIKNTSRILLDMENTSVSQAIKEYLENNNIEVVKINVWNASEDTYCLCGKIRGGDLSIPEITGKISNDYKFEMINLEVVD